MFLYHRPFSHSCKQRHQLEARVDKIRWFVWNRPPEPRPHFFKFAHWSVMRERFISNCFYTVSNEMINFIHYYKFCIKNVLQKRLKRAARHQFWLNQPTRYMSVDSAHQRLENPNRFSLAHYSALYKRGAMGSKNKTFVYHISRRL